MSPVNLVLVKYLIKDNHSAVMTAFGAWKENTLTIQVKIITFQLKCKIRSEFMLLIIIIILIIKVVKIIIIITTFYINFFNYQ